MLMAVSGAASQTQLSALAFCALVVVAAVSLGLFVSAFGSFWPPKTAADCQTLIFSASFYKIRWVKNHPKST
jgi:hypothetical protein